MRRFAFGFVLLALGLACSGALTDTPLDDEGTDDATEGDDDDGDDDDDEEEPEPRDITEATPDCTVDMQGVLVGIPGFGGPKKDQAKGTIDVKKAPMAKARTVATVNAKGMTASNNDNTFCRGTTGDDACVGATVALEHFGLPVYQEKDGWAMVGMGRGGNIMVDGSCQRRVWIEVEKPLEVRPVTDLLDTDMGYIRAGMAIELFDDADGEPLEEQPEGSSDDIPARVLRSEDVDGRTWVKVELYDQSKCEGDQEEIAEGWMPLHDDAGRLTMWFYSDC